MKQKIMIVAIASVLGFPAAGYAALSKQERKAEQDRISAEYKSAREKCGTLSGNAKDICTAEAKGVEKIAKADLEARDKGTAKAQADARTAKAEAVYGVEKEKCDDLAGNAKNVCQKDAKAALTRAKADAKAQHEVK